jgi:hypothetical protein
MKIYISIVRVIKKAGLISLLILSSCEDFLEKPPQGMLTQETFPTTANDAELAVNAVYNTLRIPNFNSGLFPILDIMSDDANKGSNPDDAANAIGPYDRFEHVATEGSLLRWWNTLYEGIKRANVVIEIVPDIAMDLTLQNRNIAEASFLRALFYFDMVRAWGGVPIITSTEPSADATRATKAEVFSLIEDDLLFAIANLPEKSGYGNPADLGRATKGAAKSLLARVYLFQQNFADAASLTLEVINSGEYNLEMNFEDANSVLGEHGIESVFEVGAFGQEGIQNGGNQYANVQGVRGTPNRGWGFNRPTMDLINAFEPNDPRMNATIIFLGEVLDGVPIMGDGSTPDETTDSHGNIELETYNQKVWTPGSNVPPSHGHNRRIIRYADVLLMAAEALNEVGNPGQALVYLNLVRERARQGNNTILPDITETDQTLLRDIIYNERRVELALEGQRFWDLLRTGQAQSVLGPLGFTINKDELLPLPQDEIDLTQGRLEQNPGW